MQKDIATIENFTRTVPNTHLKTVSVPRDDPPLLNQEKAFCAIVESTSQIDLSSDLFEEVFKLFVLGGMRLTQMTRTFDDVNAVFKLLEEKEKDLELAARIGQTLVESNKEVTSQKNILEEKLSHALEEVSQLQHEISKKDELLHIHLEDESTCSSNNLTSWGSKESLQTCIELLESKIAQLEKEKDSLIEENGSMQFHSKDFSIKQQKPLFNNLSQLNVLQSNLEAAKSKLSTVTNDLSKCSTETAEQQNEISILVDQVTELQKMHCELVEEHNNLQLHLSTANKSQNDLLQEVKDLENKYAEAINQLEETRDEMYGLIDSPAVLNRNLLKCNNSPNQELLFSDPLAANAQKSQYLKRSSDVKGMLSIPRHLVMSDVESESLFSSCKSDVSQEKPQTMQFPVKRRLQLLETNQMSRPSTSKRRQFILDSSLNNTNSNISPLAESFKDMGQPGKPGTADFNQSISEKTCVKNDSFNVLKDPGYFVHNSDNMLSVSSSIKKHFSTPKLRIVKPLEGSATLSKWKTLADNRSLAVDLKPSEETPGIAFRTGLNLKPIPPACQYTGNSGIVLSPKEKTNRMVKCDNRACSLNLSTAVHCRASFGVKSKKEMLDISTTGNARKLTSFAFNSKFDMSPLHGCSSTKQPETEL